MNIKEGSTAYIIDGNDTSMHIISKIKVESDIEIEGNGNGYTFLLRSEGNECNSIFESEEITKVNDNLYEIKGYFKDAILVISRYGKNSENTMHESYTTYD